MSSVVETGSLREVFKALLEEAISRQRLEVAEGTEFYLVNLLADFAASDHLFTEVQEGKKDHEPLAVLYHRAQVAEREQRVRMLRRLGDISLYKVGFFSEALRNTSVGTEYYIQMGGAAYGRLADMASQSGFSAVYRELCEKFRSFTEVLEEIAARGLIANGPAGTLKVYETWARTGSGRLERVLVDLGVLTPKSSLPN